MGVHAPQVPAGLHQVRQAEQVEQLHVVFGQTAVAGLAMFKQALHDMDAMLNLDAHARLRPFQLFNRAAQRVLLENLTLGRPQSRLSVIAFVRVLVTLCKGFIAGVAQYCFLAAMQQRVRLRHVGHVAGSAEHGVDQAGSHVHANARIHVEVTVVALHRLMHLRIAFLVSVLGRWRRRYEGGVDDGAFTHRQTFAGQVPLISLKTLGISSFASSTRRNLSSVVASGADSCVRWIPTKLRTH